MSLILEALKKAERQHKLGEVPGLGARVVNPPAAGLHGLGWLMLILLAAVMLGLGLYLGGFRLTVPEKEGASRLPNQAASPWVESMPSTEPPPSSGMPPPQQAPVPLEARPPVAPAADERPSPPPPKRAEIPARPLSEMPSGFVANLPPLNIDIHSYDPRPAKRYVLINMEKYHEGDYLAEGPQLIEILPDGAVLEHLGERFIMPIGNQ